MSKFSSAKSYLGDGVYAQFDGYDVVLTTENGISTTNQIVLEPEVLDALDKWLRLRFATDYAAPVHEK